MPSHRGRAVQPARGGATRERRGSPLSSSLLSSQRPLDPVLYARVIILLQKDDRDRAIAAVQQEMGLDATDAAAYVDTLWERYCSEELPVEARHPPRQSRPWMVPLLAAAVAVLGAVWYWLHGM